MDAATRQLLEKRFIGTKFYSSKYLDRILEDFERSVTVVITSHIFADILCIDKARIWWAEPVHKHAFFFSLYQD